MTHRAVSCAIFRTASFATTPPPTSSTGRTHGASLSSSQARIQNHAGSCVTPPTTARFCHCAPRSHQIQSVSTVPDLGPPARPNFERTKIPSGASLGQVPAITPSTPHPTWSYAACILVSSSYESQTPVSSHMNQQKDPSFTWLNLTNAQCTAMLPQHMQRYVEELRF